LGLPEGADKAQIRHAYSERTKIYHVETQPEEFGKLHEAYKTALTYLPQASHTKHYASFPEREDSRKRTASPEEEDSRRQTASPEEEDSRRQTASPEEEDSRKRTASPEEEDSRKQTASPEEEDSRKQTASPQQEDFRKQITESGRCPEKQVEEEQDSLEDLLRETLGETFSVRECRELIQLIYHKCRYEERGGKESQVSVLAEGDVFQQPDGQEMIGARWESRPTDWKLFLGTLWKDWKSFDWICLICHPDFLREQYTSGFLQELLELLREENLNGRDGISQSLYFALCMAYGFFYDDCQEVPAEPLSQESLKEILKILRAHPRRQEYVQDMQNWTELLEDHNLVLFVQKAFRYSRGEGDSEERQVFAEIFPDRAEEKLMADPGSQKGFIAMNLLKLPGALFSKVWAQRIKDCEALQRLREEFFQTFKECHDFSRPENNMNIQDYRYRPRLDLLEELKDRYGIAGGRLQGSRIQKPMDGGSGEKRLESDCAGQNHGKRGGKSLKKIVCNPIFMQNFWQWLHPGRSEMAFDPRYLEYDSWKEIRQLFDGGSSFEKSTLERMKTEVYFREYEKRYQKELQWQAQRLEDEYFREYFPIPPLNENKVALLQKVEQGTTVGLEEVSALFGGISKFDEDAFRLLNRITNAMVHFNCLLVWPKHEKDPVPGDAFCFLKDEVILFRKKENRKCHLSHAAFYDIISRYFDLAAENAARKKVSYYTEDFLDTCCANMYLYRCYINEFRASS